MTKKKNLAKNALKNPELFSPAELAYFQLWLKKRKEQKARLKSKQQATHELTSGPEGSSQT